MHITSVCRYSRHEKRAPGVRSPVWNLESGTGEWAEIRRTLGATASDFFPEKNVRQRQLIQQKASQSALVFGSACYFIISFFQNQSFDQCRVDAICVFRWHIYDFIHISDVIYTWHLYDKLLCYQAVHVLYMPLAFLKLKATMQVWTLCCYAASVCLTHHVPQVVAVSWSSVQSFSHSKTASFGLRDFAQEFRREPWPSMELWSLSTLTRQVLRILRQAWMTRVTRITRFNICNL